MTITKQQKLLNGSLERLNVDYVDLLLLHSSKFEGITEAYKELEDIYKNKQARAIGVSNFTVENLEELLKTANIIPAVNQVECNTYYKQKDLHDYCKVHNILLQAYMPLARTKMGFENNILEDIAKKYCVTVPQVMLRYLIDRNIPIIPKTCDKSKMKENLDTYNFSLTQEDIEKIEQIPEGKPLCSASPGFEETI